MARSQAQVAEAATLLKSDVFGRVERVDAGPAEGGAVRDGAAGGNVVRRVACGSVVPFSRLIARTLMARERAALQRLSGLDGVPGIVRDDAREGILVRTWIEGMPLSGARALPENFFDELDALVEALHARGVCHNDLHKEQNVLVGADGRPWLVDFQLASLHERGDATLTARAREDLRHVEKHRRRYTRDGRGPRGERLYGRGARERRSPIARVWRAAGKPVYNAIVHALLRRPPSEVARPSSGPWPAWTAAVTPRNLAVRRRQ